MPPETPDEILMRRIANARTIAEISLIDRNMTIHPPASSYPVKAAIARRREIEGGIEDAERALARPTLEEIDARIESRRVKPPVPRAEALERIANATTHAELDSIENSWYGAGRQILPDIKKALAEARAKIAAKVVASQHRVAAAHHLTQEEFEERLAKLGRAPDFEAMRREAQRIDAEPEPLPDLVPTNPEPDLTALAAQIEQARLDTDRTLKIIDEKLTALAVRISRLPVATPAGDVAVDPGVVKSIDEKLPVDIGRVKGTQPLPPVKYDPGEPPDGTQTA